MLLGLLFTVSCNSRATTEFGKPASSIPTTPVSALQSAPATNSTIYVKGSVGAIVPLLEGTVYELQDATGKVWILTKQPPPKPGEEVTIQGTVRYKPITINGKEQGSIYIEQE
jgi:hypothetical protein